MHKISLIIPLRLTAGTFEGETRLRRICRTVPRDLFDILIVDYGTEEAHAGPINALEAEGIEVVRHPAPEKLFSIGRARDFGVQMARQPVIMFNDIDFLAPEAMYRRIHAEVMRRDMARNLFDFFCVPVLFLTEAGTKRWFEALADGVSFVKSFEIEWLEANTETIQFTAFGSSAMVVNRHHYLSLGGHNPQFHGHGAEDYDLLHRLASLAPKGPRPHDYYTDYRDNGVRKYWGFRPFFALHGLDLFFAGIYLVHLWHPRRQERGYFRSAPNFKILRTAMVAFDRTGAQPPPLTDPHSSERWLVLYRSERDVALLRQLVPFASEVRWLKVTSSSDLRRREEIQAGLTRIIVAPDAMGGMSDPVSSLGKAGLPALLFEASDDSGLFRLVAIDAVQDGTNVGRLSGHSRTGFKNALFFWEHLKLPGVGAVASGRLLTPMAWDAPLFAPFGGPVIADPARHTRPLRRKKSPAWVRLWRRLSGY